MKTDSDAGVLLDTCTIIFISSGKVLNDGADRLVGRAARDGVLYISPISAWEIGMGATRGRLVLPKQPLTYFNDFIQKIGAVLDPLTPEILVHSCEMPGRPHKDPMDRILIAAARIGGRVLVTSDAAILSYGAAGHVRALAC